MSPATFEQIQRARRYAEHHAPKLLSIAKRAYWYHRRWSLGNAAHLIMVLGGAFERGELQVTTALLESGRDDDREAYRMVNGALVKTAQYAQKIREL